jgi:hypothetical protein
MKILAKVATGIWLVVVVYFGYLGVTDKTIENDSRIYHIPIAQSVLTGKVLTGEGYASPFSYYPGASEMILAGLMALRIPVNLFNVIGLVALGMVTWKLAQRAGISGDGAIILAASVTMLPTVLRLPMTQLVDIWLAVWWAGWIYLAKKPEKNWKYIVTLGLVTGMLIGTKILGPILLVIGLGFCGKKLMRGTGATKMVAGVVISGIVGGWWYARNWIVKGNPVYPLDLLGWKGDPGSQLPIVWKFLVRDRGAFRLFIQALGSEFLGWAGLFLGPIFVRNKWIWLGLVNALIFLILPGSPGTIVSNCRYLLPAIIPLMIGVWRWAEDNKRGEWLAIMAVVNMVAVLPQLDYKPKITIISIIILGILLWKKDQGFPQSGIPVRRTKSKV